MMLSAVFTASLLLEGLVISSGAAAISGSNAAREDALNGAPVNVGESFSDMPNFLSIFFE